MPGRPKRRRVTSLHTLVGAVVSGVVAIATRGNKAVLVSLVALAILFLIFSIVLWYEMRHETRQSRTSVDLRPDRLAKTLDPTQLEAMTLALGGAVTDVAGVLGIPAEKLRANLFTLHPRTHDLRMVKGLCHNLDNKKEQTIRIEVGRGSTGIAWRTGDSNKAVWNAGWGKSNLEDERELRKVDPELRWILSVPIFGSKSPGAQMVLNVDGLSETPADDRLSTALTHLPRFAQGISRVLGL